eukprot:TRINITY_DN16140_c0_g1_i2.p1 TRINITY_DN16140_c0_g1~~TRINITY_DN16140_c0_g1_i2.p1  ORF type:complete len:856 (+),score=69.12 TRINITY_DN16140_c0_g1_i2:51-2570(+)
MAWKRIDLAKLKPVYWEDRAKSIHPEDAAPSGEKQPSRRGTREDAYLTILMCAAETTIKVVYAKLQGLQDTGFDNDKLRKRLENGKEAADAYFMGLQKLYPFSEWDNQLNKHQDDPNKVLPDLEHCKKALGEKRDEVAKLLEKRDKEYLLMLILVLASNAGLKRNVLSENARKICEIDKSVLYGNRKQLRKIKNPVVSTDFVDALFACPPHDVTLRVKYIDKDNMHYLLMARQKTSDFDGSIAMCPKKVNFTESLWDTLLDEMQNWGKPNEAITSELFEKVTPLPKYYVEGKFGFYKVEGFKEKLTEQHGWLKELPENYEAKVRFSCEKGDISNSEINLEFCWSIGNDRVELGFGDDKYKRPKHRYVLNLHLDKEKADCEGSELRETVLQHKHGLETDLTTDNVKEWYKKVRGYRLHSLFYNTVTPWMALSVEQPSFSRSERSTKSNYGLWDAICDSTTVAERAALSLDTLCLGVVSPASTEVLDQKYWACWATPSKALPEGREPNYLVTRTTSNEGFRYQALIPSKDTVQVVWGAVSGRLAGAYDHGTAVKVQEEMWWLPLQANVMPMPKQWFDCRFADAVRYCIDEGPKELQAKFKEDCGSLRIGVITCMPKEDQEVISYVLVHVELKDLDAASETGRELPAFSNDKEVDIIMCAYQRKSKLVFRGITPRAPESTKDVWERAKKRNGGHGPATFINNLVYQSSWRYNQWLSLDAKIHWSQDASSAVSNSCAQLNERLRLGILEATSGRFDLVQCKIMLVVSDSADAGDDSCPNAIVIREANVYGGSYFGVRPWTKHADVWANGKKMTKGDITCVLIDKCSPRLRSELQPIFSYYDAA